MEVMIAYIPSWLSGPAGTMGLASFPSIATFFCREGGTFPIGSFFFCNNPEFSLRRFQAHPGFRCEHAEPHGKKPGKLSVPEAVQCPVRKIDDDAVVDHGRYDSSRVGSQLPAYRKTFFCVDIVVNDYFPAVDPCAGSDKLKRVTILDGIDQIFPHNHAGERERAAEKRTGIAG